MELLNLFGWLVEHSEEGIVKAVKQGHKRTELSQAAARTQGGNQMELIAYLFVLHGAGVIGMTVGLTVFRYLTLRRFRDEAPREPIGLMAVADWTLFSGPGLSLGASLVNFGCLLARNVS